MRKIFAYRILYIGIGVIGNLIQQRILTYQDLFPAYVSA